MTKIDLDVYSVGGFMPYQSSLFDSLTYITSPADAVEKLVRADPARSVVVFEGGADITPLMYGRANLYSSTQIHRDVFELFVWQIVKRLNLAYFGICRGHQFLAAMHGATLVQDISRQLGVSHGGSHNVTVIDLAYDELFSQAPFGPYRVNSLHHQSVELPLTGDLRLVATDSTGLVVEAVEYERGFSLQCHPEMVNWTEPVDWLMRRLRGDARGVSREDVRV